MSTTNTMPIVARGSTSGTRTSSRAAAASTGSYLDISASDSAVHRPGRGFGPLARPARSGGRHSSREWQAPERSFPERRHFLGNRGLIARSSVASPASCSPIVAPRAVTMLSATTTAAMTAGTRPIRSRRSRSTSGAIYERQQDREHDGQEDLPPDVQRIPTRQRRPPRPRGPRATASAAATSVWTGRGTGTLRMNDIPDGRGRGPVLKRPRSVNDPRRFPPMGPFAPLRTRGGVPIFEPGGRPALRRSKPPCLWPVRRVPDGAALAWVLSPGLQILERMTIHDATTAKLCERRPLDHGRSLRGPLAGRRPAVLMLHGADGLSSNGQYRSGAHAIAAAGYQVFLVHYLDRTAERRASFATVFQNLVPWMADGSPRAPVGGCSTGRGPRPDRGGRHLSRRSARAHRRGNGAARQGARRLLRSAAAGRDPERSPAAADLILHGGADPIVLVANAYAIENLPKSKARRMRSRSIPGRVTIPRCGAAGRDGPRTVLPAPAPHRRRGGAPRSRTALGPVKVDTHITAKGPLRLPVTR